jgi:hypothetical protein
MVAGSSGYGDLGAMAAMLAMTELLNLLFTPGKAKELPFKDLGRPMEIDPDTTDASDRDGRS